MHEIDNKVLFGRFVQYWNDRDLDGMRSIWSLDLQHHTRTGTLGPEHVAHVMADFMASFPDLHFEIQQLVCEDDLVSARMTARFTHSREFMGVAPTGRTVEVTVMGMVRVEDGKFVEHWNVMDEVHLLAQVGVIPPGVLDAIAVEEKGRR